MSTVPAAAKHVLLVGHCTPDASFINISVSKAVPGSKITRVNEESQLQKLLGEGMVDLLLINRVLEPGIDDSDGIALIKRVRRQYPSVGMMLVSNLSQAQHEAQAAGALEGFGKNDLRSGKLSQVLKKALG